MELDVLTKEELKEIRAWAIEKRDHFDNILKKIDSRLNKQNMVRIIDTYPSTVDEKSHSLSNDMTLANKDFSAFSVNELIVFCLKMAKKLYSTNELRIFIQEHTERRISNNGIRVQLKKDEGLKFKRSGKGKYTKWKLIE